MFEMDLVNNSLKNLITDDKFITKRDSSAIDRVIS